MPYCGMDRKASSHFVDGRYPYGAIERSLGAVFGADTATQRGALRGRLKRLSTLGLPEVSPGKGTRRQYSFEQACQLLIALLMEDAGLDPIVVARAVKNAWPELAEKVEAAETAPDQNPHMVALRLRVMSGPWTTRNRLTARASIYVMPVWNERLRNAKKGIEDGETNNLMHMMKRESDLSTWVAGQYLTPRLRKLRAALVGLSEAVHERA